MVSIGLRNQCIVIILILVCVTIKVSHASESCLSKAESVISLEYLAPTEESRDIETVNLDLSCLISRLEKLNLLIYVGIIGTYATGSITQLEGSLQAGTLREVRYDSSAFGLGPGLLVSFLLIDSGTLSFHLNGSGNFIVYNREFPAGCDYYNFMWRGGPVLDYKIGKSKSVGVSYQWAHVSNGQGLGPQNPSYDAHGFALRLRGFF